MTLEENSASNESKVHQDPQASFEPFDIVLVDIHKAAIENRIHCVRKRLVPGSDLKYVAISYRWGELDETVVPAVGYNAHITSFELDDFRLLCEVISQEVDLQLMQYVWVDAICVDQVSETRRKETIYHMNDIYEQANWIVAVPDLHLAYLKKNRTNNEVLEWIDTNACYMYYIIKNNGVRVEELLNDWMLDELSAPENLRCYLSTSVYKRRGTDTRKREYKNKKRARMLFEKLVVPGDPEEIEQITVEGRLFNSNGWSSILCPPPSICTEATPEQQLLQRQFNMVFQLSKWQRAIDERHQRLKSAFEFLAYLVEDWSTRTWVISEYNIAKKKNNKVLKYCFISLGWVYAREASNVRLFEIDFRNNHPTIQVDRQQLHYPLTFDYLHEGYEFRQSIQDMMINTSFLDMLLWSRASKVTDRFHAILPLSKEYSHHLKDSNTINAWKIVDMGSVRMKIRQWFTLEENIWLLFYRDYPNTISVPSFDHDMKRFDQAAIKAELASYLSINEYQCNFDLDPINPSVILVDAVDSEIITANPPLRYWMHIFPKVYGSRSIDVHQDIYSIIPLTTWHNLQLDPSVDVLTHLIIPLGIRYEYHSCEKKIIKAMEGSCVLDLLQDTNLHLIGTHDKNIWIALEGYYLESIDEGFECSDNWRLHHHRHDDRELGLRVY